MPDRQVIIDVETTGFEDEDIVVEVAWRDLHGSRWDVFVPVHDVRWVLDRARRRPETAKALEITGYRERIPHAPQDVDGVGIRRLAEVLTGHTLAGSTPSFDAAHLSALLRAWGLPPRPWHHRLVDVANLAAQEFGLPYNDLPGLARVCELLGVVNTAEHTAMGDVDATGRCLLALADGRLTLSSSRSCCASRDGEH